MWGMVTRVFMTCDVSVGSVMVPRVCGLQLFVLGQMYVCAVFCSVCDVCAVWCVGQVCPQ